jgi:hypothetical protein
VSWIGAAVDNSAAVVVCGIGCRIFFCGVGGRPAELFSYDDPGFGVRRGRRVSPVELQLP